MTGVSLCQWRFSIGMLNLKHVCKHTVNNNNNNNNNNCYLNVLFKRTRFQDIDFDGTCRALLRWFLDYWLCSLTVAISLLPPFLMVYSFLNLIGISLCFRNYFIFAFSSISLLPSYYISASFQITLSLLKCHFSEEPKNILFYAFVLQILLFISGSVELDPYLVKITFLSLFGT